MTTRFVETDAVESGWRVLTSTEKHWAEQLLDAVGMWIRGKVDDVDAKQDAAEFVSIDTVRGALAPGTQLGMAAFSKTIGPWSKSGTLVNPLGHIAITKFHKELLGISDTSVPLYQFKDQDY